MCWIWEQNLTNNYCNLDHRQQYIYNVIMRPKTRSKYNCKLCYTFRLCVSRSVTCHDFPFLLFIFFFECLFFHHSSDGFFSALTFVHFLNNNRTQADRWSCEVIRARVCASCSLCFQKCMIVFNCFFLNGSCWFYSNG